MALVDIWLRDGSAIVEKHVQQLIAFCGNGKLQDNGVASLEFRQFLAKIPVELLGRYGEDCLSTAFTDSGLALQDIVNEYGDRFGAMVTRGRYRGTSSQPGHDGLWVFPSGHGVVVEVKTTDAYRVDLQRIQSYRATLVEQGQISAEKSSILIVVGRQDTGELEAQVRGSRLAWDVRLISVSALRRLIEVKEDLDDPRLIERVHSVLVPREFTRLDEIVDLLFSTAADIAPDEAPPPESAEAVALPDDEPKRTPVAFNAACVGKVASKLAVELIKETRTSFASGNGDTRVVCLVSKEYDSETRPNYWFSFHPYHREYLSGVSNGYLALGCGSSERVLLIPAAAFLPLLDGTWTTETEDRMYWHVVVVREGGRLWLRRRKGQPPVECVQYLLP